MSSNTATRFYGWFGRSKKEQADAELSYTKAANKCPFPLGNDSSATLTLQDGRKLGYAEYGDKTGDVIFYLHGLPTSRVDAAWFDAEGKELGLRIIGIDRPGIGLSSPSLGRGISDHADDVRQLAEQLELQRFGVVGASGGGPYALACAARLSADRLKAVHICCGSGPVEAGRQGMHWINRAGFVVMPYLPVVARWFYRSQAGGRLDLSRDERFRLLRRQNPVPEMVGDETDFLTDDNTLLLQLRSWEEAFAQGFDGAVEDARLLSTRWDFKLEDVRTDVPIELWYGRYDNLVPGHTGQYIATKLGSKAQLHLLDHDHLGVIFQHRRQWLEHIAKQMRAV